MNEPYLTQFREHLRQRPGGRDIHDASQEVAFASSSLAATDYLEREVNRVGQHQRGFCRILERYVGQAGLILDVGCSSGGSTVAMALSPALAPRLTVGADPDLDGLRAAVIRSLGHGLGNSRACYLNVGSPAALPFPSGSFDLTVAVSVLEFISQPAGRRGLIEEMKRVTRPGGHVFLSTPNALNPREVHSKRWLGNYLRRAGFPWATSPWGLRGMFAGWHLVDISAHTLSRLPGPARGLKVLNWLLPWQKVLARKPERED